MNDRRAHFLTMVGDACTSAGLASIPVQLTFRDGTRVTGTPSPEPASDETDTDETGYVNQLRIDGSTVVLDAVVQFAITSPGPDNWCIGS